MNSRMKDALDEALILSDKYDIVLKCGVHVHYSL